MTVKRELVGAFWEITIEVRRGGQAYTARFPWDASPIEDDVFLQKLREEMRRARQNGTPPVID